MATALQRRMVGLELSENIETLKTAVDAIETVIAGWTLDGADSALPTAVDVKEQMLAYEAVEKPVNSINDAITAIREVA